MIKINRIDNLIYLTQANTEYEIYINESLEHLIKREELLKLPLSNWKDLLKVKDGYWNPLELERVLKALIKYYDKIAKSFIYKDKSYWLSKDTRMGIRNLLNNKLVIFELVLDDVVVTLSYDKAKKFMEDLELYAYKCFINTQKHLNNIKQIQTVEDLINYDYTLGYPDKLILND